MPSAKAHGDPLCLTDLVRRANVRKRRLHACGHMRLTAPKRKPKTLLELVAVAERYADGEATAADLQAAGTQVRAPRKPRAWSGDLTLAFYTDRELNDIWRGSIDRNSTYTSMDLYYDTVLVRYRLFEELVGPDLLPAFSPTWRTDTALALAKQMYESREFGAMPILADALQDAGCDNDDILDHCRDPDHRHARGCWVVDLVLGKE